VRHWFRVINGNDLTSPRWAGCFSNTDIGAFTALLSRQWNGAFIRTTSRQIYSLIPLLGDEDRAEVVNVGVGRAGDELVTERFKKGVGVVVGEGFG
jgi:hypothetical protein